MPGDCGLKLHAIDIFGWLSNWYRWNLDDKIFIIDSVETFTPAPGISSQAPNGNSLSDLQGVMR